MTGARLPLISWGFPTQQPIHGGGHGKTGQAITGNKHHRNTGCCIGAGNRRTHKNAPRSRSIRQTLFSLGSSGQAKTAGRMEHAGCEQNGISRDGREFAFCSTACRSISAKACLSEIRPQLRSRVRSWGNWSYRDDAVGALISGTPLSGRPNVGAEVGAGDCAVGLNVQASTQCAVHTRPNRHCFSQIPQRGAASNSVFRPFLRRDRVYVCA